MIVWCVALLPIVAGPLVWWVARRARLLPVVALSVSTMAATLGLAAAATAGPAHGTYRWGAGLDISLGAGGPSSVAAIVIPAVALAVIGYAAVHEERRSLGRMLGVMMIFVGAMEVLVLARDVLTLLIAWEAVGACSWALIGHQWRDATTVRSANAAFVVTHIGDLALFAAAGAAFAGTGSLDYARLAGLHGWALHVTVAGVVVAAAAKSAQLPFSPWLFAAMAGPTSVSALLHSATMVAAGAFVIIRLHPVLDTATWFAPVVMGIGLSTAVAGGFVALRQTHAKKILAASTSAHYGLMFVAAGAGYPAIALAHLVTHAVLKASLFMSAGVAIEAAGTADARKMRLGNELRVVAAATAVLALALAGIPPLGAAWTKEEIIASAGTRNALLAVTTAIASALSAAYAMRFQLLVYGRNRGAARPIKRRPSAVERAVLIVGATGCVVAGALWLSGAGRIVGRLADGGLPDVSGWNAPVSLMLIALAGYAAFVRFRQIPTNGYLRQGAGEWFGIETAVGAAVVGPVLRSSNWMATRLEPWLDAPPRALARVGRITAARAATFDVDVLHGAVRSIGAAARAAARVCAAAFESTIDGVTSALAALIGSGGADARRSQTGQVHQYYAVIVAAAAVAAAAVAVWR